MGWKHAHISQRLLHLLRFLRLPQPPQQPGIMRPRPQIVLNALHHMRQRGFEFFLRLEQIPIVVLHDGHGEKDVDVRRGVDFACGVMLDDVAAVGYGLSDPVFGVSFG